MSGNKSLRRSVPADRIRTRIVHESDDEHAEPASDLEPGETSETTPTLDELLEGSVDSRDPAIAPVEPRTRVGRFVEWASGQPPTVEFAGNHRAARSIIPLDPTIIAEAIASQRGVLLTFEDGRPDAPIITGLLQDFVTQSPVEPQPWDSGETAEQPSAEPALTEVEARVDGRRIELEAADEIVLRCGQASIVLRRNGRVVIRGTYVESRSTGVNRVKGGSVQIN